MPKEFYRNLVSVRTARFDSEVPSLHRCPPDPVSKEKISVTGGRRRSRNTKVISQELANVLETRDNGLQGFRSDSLSDGRRGYFTIKCTGLG